MKQKTNEQYIKELKNINPNVTPLEGYNGAKNKIKHQCNICGHKWSVTPSHLLSGTHCPNCDNNLRSKKQTKSNQQYIEELKVKNPTIISIEKYNGTHTKIKHQCLKCGYIWNVEPAKLLSNRGCPQCNGGILKSHNTYIKDLLEINPNIEVLGKYINSQTQIEHKCLIHNYVWNARPNDLLRGKGCPICKASHGEKEIEKILKKYNVKYYAQYRFEDCKYKRALPFDFYLPDYNMCIEFQGRQHFESVDYFGGELALKETQKRDNIKREYCLSHNIKLLYILHFEYDNIDNILYDNLYNKEKQII